MPKTAKTFAFGRKKRCYKKLRGKYATAKDLDLDVNPENDAGVDHVGNDSLSPSTSTTVDASPENVASLFAAQSERELDNDQDQNLDVSRSEQKLSAFFDDASTASLDKGRYFFIHSSFLDSLLEMITCPTCFGSDISLSKSSDIGLACSLQLKCMACKKTFWSKTSSPKSSRHYDINIRAVVASKECGVSLTTMRNMFNILNVPNFMHHNTYKDISLRVRSAAMETAEEVMIESASIVKERHRVKLYSSDQVSPSGIQVVGVSYDGTWHKRGHSSHYGVGVAIDIDSGLVLDAFTVSNYCASCRNAPQEDSPNFKTWKDEHALVCNKNFEGSSNAMEARAAEVIFGRSIQKRNLIYGTMLCDGDSKALNRINELKCYDIEVRKEDCVNHIAKRIFNQLEQVKKDNKKQLNRKLTAAKIKKITNTYATNLRENAPNVENMKLGVMGGLFHMMSTDAAPNHRLCPDGETSWCKYKRALAKGEKPPPHNPTISTDVGKFVFPIIKRLTNPELLARCAKMTTQNPNESFNATIWKRCPKVLFAHLPTVETAVALSVISFNVGPSGMKRVFDKLGLEWGDHNNTHANKVAATRIRHSKRKGKGSSKWRRKHLHQQHLVKTDKIEELEGITYSAGGFNC